MNIPGLVRHNNIEDLYDELPAEEFFLVLRDEMRVTKAAFKEHHQQLKSIRRSIRRLQKTIKLLKRSNQPWGNVLNEVNAGGNEGFREMDDGDYSKNWYEDLDDDEGSFLDSSHSFLANSLLQLTLQCTDDEREEASRKVNGYRKRLDFGENIEANPSNKHLQGYENPEESWEDIRTSSRNSKLVENGVYPISDDVTAKYTNNNKFEQPFLDDASLQNFSDICSGNSDAAIHTTQHRNNRTSSASKAERKERRRRLREKIRSFSESTLGMHESITLLAQV